jgi:hypothetical protein
MMGGGGGWMHLHTKKGWVKRVQATGFGLAYGRTVRCRETAYSGGEVIM